jgi:hypothetical protein
MEAPGGAGTSSIRVSVTRSNGGSLRLRRTLLACADKPISP